MLLYVMVRLAVCGMMSIVWCYGFWGQSGAGATGGKGVYCRFRGVVGVGLATGRKVVQAVLF